MQPESQPEDIQTILSRFHTWAGKNPGNGNERKLAPQSDSVREIPYEEAMRNFRQRQKAQTRRAAAAALRSVAPPAPSEPAPSKPEEALPALAATTPKPDAVRLAEARTESAALATRPPAAIVKATQPLQSSEKNLARKNTGSPTRRACAQSVALAVLPLQPKPARAQLKTSTPSKSEPRRAAPAKKSVALAVRLRTPQPKKTAFKRVLAGTVRAAVSSAQSTGKTTPAPDRSRRITTRFSTAEQRRLERAADQAGLTVSAWLRQCALRAEIASAPAPRLAAHGKNAKTALPLPPAGSTLFSTPAASPLGNWLTLLRQRFLASPARLSERA
ncbi:MAG TPA: hypothetical protein VFE06_13690 [Acidobacteriaceae bacterium]|nr:hypothetical protein [Acidobacteriaceae bacterium]